VKKIAGIVLVTILFGSLLFAADKAADKTKTAAKPKITMAQAEKIALGKEPGTIKSKELEKEKGKLLYSFDIQTKDAIHEVNVDAMSGEVVEDVVEDAAKEAQEKAEEMKHKKSKTPQ